jgi:hypothetical protein
MPNGKPQPPATQGQSVQSAMGSLRGYAQNTYGKSISDQEFQQYGKKVGFQGDTVNDDQYNAARQEIDRAYGPGQAGPKVAQDGPPPTNYPTPLPPTVQYQPQFAPQIQGHLGNILQNPGTMNQQWQDQQYEAGKEQALALRQQFGEQSKQQMAGRGWSGGSGVQSAILAGLDETLASQLLAGRRDIATQAAQTNRADTYNAINAAQGYDQQGFGNAQAQNAQNLAFWQAQEAARSGNQSFDLQRWLADQNVNIEREQFGKTFGLDFLRFLENRDQFGKTFGEGQRQFNNTMGLNWFNAQGNQNNSLLNYFIQAGL